MPSFHGFEFGMSIAILQETKNDLTMAKTFLDYFKTILPNFSFDTSLLAKEYQKALQYLNTQEQFILESWLNNKGYKLQPKHISH